MAQNKTVFDGMINRLEKICCKLVEIKDLLTNQTVPTEIAINNTCDNPVNVKICSDENLPKYDWELVCLTNDGGLNIVNGIVVYNMTTDIPIQKIYINGTEVSGYDIVSCNKDVKYDYEKETICVDGKNWTKWYVWDKINDNIPNLVTILWLDHNDIVVSPPDNNLINNSNCRVCNPLRESFYGNNSTITEFNHIRVDIPACCEVTITTSDGVITLPAKKQNYIYTETWDCLVNNYTISSLCVDNILTIIKKTK